MHNIYALVNVATCEPSIEHRPQTDLIGQIDTGSGFNELIYYITMSTPTSGKQWTSTILMNATEIKDVAYTVLQSCKMATFLLQTEIFCYMHHQYVCTSVYDGKCNRHFMQGIRFLVSLHAESQLVQLKWNVFITNRLHHFCFVSKLSVKMVASFYVIQTN